MIHTFSVKNFYTFRDKTSVSFKLNQHAPNDERSVQLAHGSRLNKVMVVLGPNGSGKTRLIQALVFLMWFIKHSFEREPDDLIPLRRHFFVPKNEMAEMTLEFDVDEVIWRYQVTLSEEMVYAESLDKKNKSRYIRVFERQWDEKSQLYQVEHQRFGQIPNANKIRKNASFISIAKQYEIQDALLLGSTRSLFYATNIDIRKPIGDQSRHFSKLRDVTKFYDDNPNIQLKMVALLREWDLGLADMEIEKNDELGIVRPFGIHCVKEKIHRLRFQDESNGTQVAFILLGKILHVLAQGGIAIVDELESGLHPHMLKPIVDLFISAATNPYNAQIIFTCHASEILNMLHKGQVILVEKDEQCESHAWRLDQMRGVRADDNLYVKYMAGLYGGVPFL